MAIKRLLYRWCVAFLVPKLFIRKRRENKAKSRPIIYFALSLSISLPLSLTIFSILFLSLISHFFFSMEGSEGPRQRAEVAISDDLKVKKKKKKKKKKKREILINRVKAKQAKEWKLQRGAACFC
jgi:hypothetical protein